MRPRTLEIVAVGFLSLIAPSTFAAELSITSEEAQASSTQYVTPTTVRSWMEEEKSVTFLDVREADEFAAGHLPDATNIHYDQVASLAERLPHDRPIVLYCIHSAHRAPEAAETLRRHGFTNVYVLEGGIVAWQADGLMILASDSHKTPTILPVTERCANKPKPSG